MRILLIFLISFLILGSAYGASSGRVVYKGQGHSMIQWDQQKAENWTDFELWKKDIYLKDQLPNWRQVLREQGLKESVGRVLQCVGSCLVETGEGSSRAIFRSNINELEDVRTEKDSYAWIFLYDGTMVRLSPNTSITFKEINIGRKENFFHLRINYGNVLWLSRQKSMYRNNSERETDLLFMPLDLYEANSKTVIADVNEDNLFEYLEKSTRKKNRVTLLNELIATNNSFAENKNTRAMIVMPNGTILAKNPSMEFIVLVGGKSYYKRRDRKQLDLKGETDATEVEVFYRGFENYESTNPELATWYELNKNGRKSSFVSSNLKRLFAMGEFVTKRMSTIMVARELLIKRYSKFAFADMSRLELARDFGYRQWVHNKGKRSSEIDQRIEYLKEYTRRMETTNILASKKIKGQYVASRKVQRGSVYTNHFYTRAINTYLRRGDATTAQTVDYRELNSTRRPLWKRMHAIR